MSGRAPLVSGPFGVKRTRGNGCKNDGGPLWVTVELIDNEDYDNLTSPAGGGDRFRTLYGRIF